MKLRALALAGLFASSLMTTAHASDVELVKIMSALQYFTHKTTLAIDAKNPDLAAFYAHELEELIEELEEVESYHNQPIASFVTAILEPSFESLEQQIKSQDWPQSSDAMNALIDSCNKCHQATQHGFILIERRADNPYFQQF